MSKFLDLIKKHPIASLSIVVGAAALVISGSVFVSSAVTYNKYSDEYEDMKAELLEIIETNPQLPKEVFKDNEFVDYDDENADVLESKSSYKNTYLMTIDDAEIDLDSNNEPDIVTFGDTAWQVATGFKKGGSITYKIDLAYHSRSDIDVYLGLGEIKNVPIDNLIDFITIKINGLNVNTIDFDLPSDGSLQQLVLKNTNLIEGENTLEFATSVGDEKNNFIMPAIAAVTFFTNADLA